jgi:transcriptional regulator with XRE-family HTH domain
MGLTQYDLAQACGVTFQQIQKYECASSRISAARLWRLAVVLEAPVAYFYEGLGVGALNRDLPPPEALSSQETNHLIEAFYQLPERPRRQLLELVKAMSRESSS